MRQPRKYIGEEGAGPQWQQHYKSALTDEDARDIARNISGYFDLLDEWEKQSTRMYSGEHFQVETMEDIDEQKENKKCA